MLHKQYKQGQDFAKEVKTSHKNGKSHFAKPEVALFRLLDEHPKVETATEEERNGKQGEDECKFMYRILVLFAESFADLFDELYGRVKEKHPK